ncbi:hypothetical protein N7457_000466 [Penicillium paradoxum]|uniref:uncharacterized protein n=1 Tax=Penicillium paradoxum TaxID=176176 RepID=UPI0025479D82|nr:uncharacterized protein N7457_000466 [Penicillium paradoxum]KAJ5793867.1 hypothetical protein N7457_000466 [Penicillium paradoxum]
MENYTAGKVLDSQAPFDVSKVAGKTAIITGGASGIGEAYTKLLTQAGAYVVIADLNPETGNKLASELERTKFVKCDVTKWEDQVNLFKEAVKFSPTGRISIVAANAGLGGTNDSVWPPELDADEPTKPALRILDVNLTGVIYTTKLAIFHFRRQWVAEPAAKHETSLVIGGSLAGYSDMPHLIEYSTSKFGIRGMMRSLRRTEWRFGTRVNYIAPWFIKTPMMSNPEALGDVEFAEVSDAADAFMHIVSDSDVAGRAISIVPRSISPRGYIDLKTDDDDSEVLTRLEKGLSNSIFRR